MSGKRLEYFVIGLIVGGVLGALLGLLFAPATGAQVRRRIADEATKVAGVARKVAEQADHAAQVVGSRMDHYLGRDEEVAWRKVAEIREGVQQYSRTIVMP